MNREATRDAVMSQRGWTRLGEDATEGRALRVAVQLLSGVEGLLYVYGDEDAAHRARTAHEIVGAQLFAVPDLIESGPGWLVVERPQGRPLTSLGRDLGTTDRALMENLGELIRKVHQVPCDPFCGDIAEATTGEPAERWLTFSGYVAHHLEWFAEHLRRRDFTDEQVEVLATAIADIRHELSSYHPRTPACICHGKLDLAHVWVDDAAREVVGLTGFDYAVQSPRDADIAYLLWITGVGEHDTLTRAFYAGYGAARTMDVQRRERFYRRLVAFQTLFGAKGDVALPSRELIALTTAQAR